MKMRNLLALVVVLAAAPAQVQAQAGMGSGQSVDVTYRIEKKNVKFTQFAETQMMISKDCDANSPNSCEAMKVLNQISFSFLKSKIKGDVNPGAVLCKEVGGKEQLGVDKDQNEDTFCKFSDGSQVSCNALFLYSQKNDRK